MSRITSISNILGTFTPTYVDQTAGGGDKGTTRLLQMAYPNGQLTKYSYFPTTYDERLEEIQNLTPSGAVQSQFNYTYDSKGQMLSWERTLGSNPATTYNFSYDPAGQLKNAVLSSGGSTLHQYYYNFDAAGNRISAQADSNVTQTTPNSANQISSIAAGGPTRFQGTISQPGTVTVNGQKAFQSTSTNFVANPSLSGGTNTVAVVATNGNGAAQTNSYQVVVPPSGTITPSYDHDGNMTSNGNGQTYTWDAENRLLSITYTGGATTTFTYDAFGRRVELVESTGTTKQFIWDGTAMAEQRDGSNTVTARFFPEGEQISGTFYYYTFDHLGSVRELTDGSGNIDAQYDYDPYGNVSLLQGSNMADFQYAGMYEHQTSGLNLTLFRAYDSNTGRWLSRDPLPDAERRLGPNLYTYVANNAINETDSLGLFGAGWQVSAGAEAGDIGIGGGATAEGGAGVFVQNNFSSSGTGGFAAGGAFAGEPGANLQSPGGTGQTPWVAGASGGIGQGVFFTNANTVADLSGAFNQYNINLLGNNVSIGYDSDGTFIISISFLTRGIGLSISGYSTYTVTSKCH